MSFEGLLNGALIAVGSGLALAVDHKYTSANGRFHVVFQADGNLVLYRGTEPLWASGTQGSGASRCVFQEDGNLCLCIGAGQCVWASGTHGRCPNGRMLLCMQDDGNLCMYDPHNHCHWSTGTHGGNRAPEMAQRTGVLGAPSGAYGSARFNNQAEEGIANGSCVLVSSGTLMPKGHRMYSRNRQYCVVFQDDGNLVVYNSSNSPLWASNCHGRGGDRCVLQADGNLVIYTAGNDALWASGTHGKGSGVRLLNMQDDGNCVLYNGSGSAIWSTGTDGGRQSEHGGKGRMA